MNLKKLIARGAIATIATLALLPVAYAENKARADEITLAANDRGEWYAFRTNEQMSDAVKRHFAINKCNEENIGCSRTIIYDERWRVSALICGEDPQLFFGATGQDDFGRADFLAMEKAKSFNFEWRDCEVAFHISPEQMRAYTSYQEENDVGTELWCAWNGGCFGYGKPD